MTSRTANYLLVPIVVVLLGGVISNSIKERKFAHQERQANAILEGIQKAQGDQQEFAVIVVGFSPEMGEHKKTTTLRPYPPQITYVDHDDKHVGFLQPGKQKSVVYSFPSREEAQEAILRAVRGVGSTYIDKTPIDKENK